MTDEARGLTSEHVSLHAGVDQEAIGEFVGAGILTPDESGRFQPPDIARARLVHALVEAGLALDELTEALDDGRLSFSFVDLLMPDPVRLVPGSTDGSEAPWLRHEAALRPILGIERGRGEAIRKDDLEILRLVAEAVELGAPQDRVMQIVRAVAHAANKLSDLQRDFVDEVLLAPAIERTGSPMQALQETSAVRLRYRELGRELTGLLMERFVDEAIFRNLVRFTEAALSEVGLDSDSQQTVVFVDVSDYTGRSEEEGDLESARQAVLLAEFVRRLAARHGARMVKSLGDGAMVHARDPRTGLEMAMDAVSRAESEGLWPLHAGVNSGPMVRRDGDYFGAAVNVASRVADEAGPGEVLVSQRVAAALDDAGFRFVPIGERTLKHVRDPVAILRAERHPS